jgi:hypothetical protein
VITHLWSNILSQSYDSFDILINTWNCGRNHYFKMNFTSHIYASKMLWTIKPFLETDFEISETIDNSKKFENRFRFLTVAFQVLKVRKPLRFYTIPFLVSEISETLRFPSYSIGNRKGIPRYLLGYSTKLYDIIGFLKYLYGFRKY